MLADLDAELEPLKADVTARAVSALRAAKKVARRSLFVPKLLKPALVERVVAEGLPEVRAKKATRATLERYLMARGAYWNFSATSHAQRKILLYDILKFPKRLKSGKLTTDEEALKGLLPLDKHGIITPLLRISKCSTTRSILERMKPAPDGRIRTWYNIAGTETGRFSSAETFLEPQSTNLQNLSKKQGMLSTLYDVRRCVVPPAGHVLIEADMSQAEARVVAALCGDQALLERWQDPEFDVHKFTASRIFTTEVNNVTKEERFLGKVARHALNYGMGWQTFQRNVNGDADTTGVSISAHQAKRIVAAYHELHPNLQLWWRQVADTLARTGRLVSIFGRARTFFGRRQSDRWLDGVHKEAIAFEPQSTVADLLNRGLLRFWQEHDNGINPRTLAQVHDSVVVECTEAVVCEVAEMLRRCLEEKIHINGVDLVVPVDVSVHRESWAKGEVLSC
jgi:DNA polymerase-1